jgi:hypothetical protein
MARPPKDIFAKGFRVNSERKSVAPYYLAEPFASALAPPRGPSALFCHISWRQRDGGTMRAKSLKKATPRSVAEPFAPLCCIYKGFGGIYAILSGGNPPRYETNHTNLRRSYGFGRVTCLGRWKMAYKKPGKSSALSPSGSLASTISVYERCGRDSRQGGGPRGSPPWALALLLG